MIVDDVIGMFLAGTITIQVSSTNTVLHTTFLPEVKKKLVDEIDSKLTPIADDLLNKFTTDVTDEFSYLLMCYF